MRKKSSIEVTIKTGQLLEHFANQLPTIMARLADEAGYPAVGSEEAERLEKLVKIHMTLLGHRALDELRTALELHAD